jgi:hypothetical protein
MRERLEAYRGLFAQFIDLRRRGAPRKAAPWLASCTPEESTVKQIILTRLDPELADFNLDVFGGKHTSPSGVLTCIQQGLGILDGQDDWAVKLASDAPVLAADRFYPWVWDVAKIFWDSGHYRKVVDVAANAINAHTQALVGRRDIFDADLMKQAFTEWPKPRQPICSCPVTRKIRQSEAAHDELAGGRRVLPRTDEQCGRVEAADTNELGWSRSDAYGRSPRLLTPRRIPRCTEGLVGPVPRHRTAPADELAH